MQVTILCQSRSFAVLDYRCSAAPGDRSHPESFAAHCDADHISEYSILLKMQGQRLHKPIWQSEG